MEMDSMDVTDPLVTRARAVWEGLASVPVSFGPAGSVNVVVSPNSGLCPAGWIGAVSIGGSAIVTAPDQRLAALLRDALRGVPAGAVGDAVCEHVPTNRVLGPAALAYLSADGFRPAAPGPLVVRQLPGADPRLRALEQAAGADDTAEAGLFEITSPAFVVHAGGEVIAAAGYRSWPGRTAHISVLTAPASRRRGLARLTGSAAAAHALAAGLLPQWRARVPASRRVAAALGFRELGEQLSAQLA
ncbi:MULTISPECIES: GNAT family N-acetyltransferase [Kitasatospora]|uniref:GNAT family N-acetyltransferase n=1 Tax=Kitasatospora TaxID=2063 RepID=UPI000CB159AE|nr:GNAT family N-acetyltransferase [Kitasatospora sp. GP30]MDH6145219.1 GNAT superfamily N-acetyltransferase [Kitasatospora sp. GP30]